MNWLTTNEVQIGASWMPENAILARVCCALVMRNDLFIRTWSRSASPSWIARRQGPKVLVRRIPTPREHERLGGKTRERKGSSRQRKKREKGGQTKTGEKNRDIEYGRREIEEHGEKEKGKRKREREAKANPSVSTNLGGPNGSHRLMIPIFLFLLFIFSPTIALYGLCAFFSTF